MSDDAQSVALRKEIRRMGRGTLTGGAGGRRRSRSASASEPLSTPAPAKESLARLGRIPVRDNGEALVDILSYSEGLRWAKKHPVFVYERARLCRETLARMLAAAQARLPAGLRLTIVEGWRSPPAQRMMYAATWEEMRHLHPGWSDQALRRLVNRYSAPPDHRVPPPHVTGGAVDLHIEDAAGRILDFCSPMALTDRRGAAMAAPGLSETARANRRLLAKALEPVGLTNYSEEWWHWSYGDQGWALRTGAPWAVYGAVGNPRSAPESTRTRDNVEKPGTIGSAEGSDDEGDTNR